MSMLQLSDNSTTSTSLDDCFHPFSRIDLFHEKELLVTEGQHVASIYNTSDNMPVRCWTFSQIKPLSCPVVFDRMRKKFVAVLSKNEVHIFGRDEEIDEAERYKFRRTICCILTNPFGEPIVLFHDGAVSLLDAALANRSEEPNPNQKLEDIVKVRALIVNKRSTSSRCSMEVVIVTRSLDDQLTYNRLKIDPETQAVDNYESLQLPPLCSVYNIADDGAFGCVTTNKEVIVIRNGSMSSTTLDIPSSSLQNVRSFFFFPHEKHVVALVHEITAGAFVISTIDMRYGTSESYPLESMPLMNGIEVWQNRMFIMTAKGIIEKKFTVTPKSLSSIFGAEDADMKDVTLSETSKKRQQAEDIEFGTMSIEDIVKTMKKQRTSADINNEKRMAQLMQHLINRDPDLQSVSSDQLIEQVIRMPYCSTLLSKELRGLDPRLEAKQGLLLIFKLLDRLDEHDQYSINCIDICNSVLDVCLTQILVQKEELRDVLLDLWEKNERFTEYCRTTLRIKSMIDTIIGPVKTRVRQGKPEYEMVQIRI